MVKPPQPPYSADIGIDTRKGAYLPTRFEPRAGCLRNLDLLGQAGFRGMHTTTILLTLSVSLDAFMHKSPFYTLTKTLSDHVMICSNAALS